MQPEFALSLSFEGIALLRRVSGAWASIESISLETDDLDTAVVGLRQKAQSLAPGGARVALIIPNEQIRYLDLPDLGGDSSSRDAAIRAALDGATPYAVEELVYDHSLEGRRLLIAAVARETLAEAQSFAENYGFKPVSFLARAEEGAFSGPVFFGAVPSWKGARPTRPPNAIRIVPADEAALTPRAPAASAPAEKAPQAKETAAPVTPPTEQQAAKPADDVEAVAGAKTPPQVLPPQAKEATRPEAASQLSDKAEAVAEGSKPHQDGRTIPPGPTQDKVEKAPAAAAAAKQPQNTEEAAAPEAPPARFASIRAQKADQGDATKVPPAPDVAAPQIARRFTPVPAAPNPARDAGVTSKSIEAAPDTPDDGAKSGLSAGAAGAAAAAVRFLGRKRSRGENQSQTAKAEPAAPALSLSGSVDASAAARLAQPLPKAPEAPQVAAPAAKPTKPKGPSPLAALAAKARPAAAAPAAKTAAATMTADDERARMTVFGARDNSVGGKPRFLGLMLTAALLLFLAAVAAWATVFLDDGLASLFRKQEATTAIAVAPELPAVPIEDGQETLLETAPLKLPDAPDQPKLADDKDADPGEDVQLAALDTTPDATDAPPALAVPLSPQALTPQEAAATYAATGIWQRAPTAPHQITTDGVEDIYVASIDPKVQEFDAIALPAGNGFDRDLPIADPGLPPPSDLRFVFDERNLIRATPEGALTPEGLRIYTGPPPVVPPLRAEAIAAALSVEQAEKIAALAVVRPSARPSDLSEQRERAVLGGKSLEELAALRPVMRPRTVQEEQVVAEPEETATDRAVEKSLTPVQRPRDIARIVEKTEERKAEEPVQVASVAPRTVTPSIPSSASVAKAATVRNAINLSKVNLIGVYGTASNRRALVRLPSGGYRKVKVGDRLDGGRVAAIGETELRYTKGGRSIVLKMPRS